MDVTTTPEGIIAALGNQWQCRETQIKQLAALLPADRKGASSLVVHGAHATGKSGIIKDYLDHCGLPHAVLRSQECITGRHLLERTVSVVRASLTDSAEHPSSADEQYNVRCENLGSLVVHFQHLLSKVPKFVVVFDDVDQQREAPPTLLPALARLGETIPKLVVVLIMHHPSPGLLHQAGVAYIHFPSYSRQQSVHIVAQNPPDIFVESPVNEVGYDKDTHQEDKAWLWPRFCSAVWDAIGGNVARDLATFRTCCYQLWRPFVTPIIKGDFGTRDFSRLLVAQRRLFQDEAILQPSLMAQNDLATTGRNIHSHELPYYAKWLLISGYLASFNPSRLDELLFMKATDKKKRRKGAGGPRQNTKPGQVRKIPRHLLAASAFTLNRLLSILHAILPDETLLGNDIYKQIASLTSLRLFVRASGIGSNDPLEPGGKWRVGPMVTWDYTLGLARGLDFNLADYVVE